MFFRRCKVSQKGVRERQVASSRNGAVQPVWLWTILCSNCHKMGLRSRYVAFSSTCKTRNLCTSCNNMCIVGWRNSRRNWFHAAVSLTLLRTQTVSVFLPATYTPLVYACRLPGFNPPKELKWQQTCVSAPHSLAELAGHCSVTTTQSADLQWSSLVNIYNFSSSFPNLFQYFVIEAFRFIVSLVQSSTKRCSTYCKNGIITAFKLSLWFKVDVILFRLVAHVSSELCYRHFEISCYIPPSSGLQSTLKM